MKLSSEFARVQVTLDEEGHDPRLRIEDLRTGQAGYLDALELETLAWLPEQALQRFLDPSFHRWRGPGASETDLIQDAMSGQDVDPGHRREENNGGRG